MPHEAHHAGYLITDDPTRLDVDAIHAYLSRSYWAQAIQREIVARSLAGSLGIGLYAPDNAQVGLVRVISDYATFAYFCDVYVLEAHRGRGLGKAAIQFTMSHPRLQGLRRMQLVTRDAHGLYAPHGFKVVEQPAMHMERRSANPYTP